MFGMRWKMLQRRILCFSDLLTKRLPTSLEVFNIINHFLEEKNKLRDVNWTQLCRISGTGKKQSLWSEHTGHLRIEIWVSYRMNFNYY